MLVVVLAFGIIGCKEPGAPHELAKTTWNRLDSVSGLPLTIGQSIEFKDNGEYEYIIDDEAYAGAGAHNIRGFRGTYSISDDIITYTVKEIWIALNSDYDNCDCDDCKGKPRAEKKHKGIQGWVDVWALGMAYCDDWGGAFPPSGYNPGNPRGADFDRLNNFIRDMFRGLYEDWLDADIEYQVKTNFADKEADFIDAQQDFDSRYDDMDYYKEIMMQRYGHGVLRARLNTPIASDEDLFEQVYWNIARALENNGLPFRTTSRLTLKWHYELVDDGVDADSKPKYKEDKNVIILKKQMSSSVYATSGDLGAAGAAPRNSYRFARD